MIGEVEIEAEERGAHLRAQANLEVVGEQLDGAAGLAHRDAEVEPRPVVAPEVGQALVAALVLHAPEDAERAAVKIALGESLPMLAMLLADLRLVEEHHL